MRQLLWCGLVAMSLLVVGCVETLPVASQKAKGSQKMLTKVGSERSAAIFDMGEDEDRRQEQSRGLGLIDVPEFEAYANEILQRLKDASGVEGLPGRVFLKADIAWSAKASASGNIYIPIGMLGDIYSEDVFAALLAHELSHVIQNHTNSDLLERSTKKGVYACALLGRLSGTADIDTDVYIAAVGSMAASEIFLSPCWSRKQETQADLMGLDIVIKAGYSPNAMELLLEVLAVMDERNRLERERRQKALQEAHAKTRSEALQKLDIDSVLKSGFTEVIQSTGSMLKGLMVGHEEGNERLKKLRAYKKEHYRRSPRKELTIEPWQQALNTEKIRNAVASVEKALQAQDLLLGGDVRQSETVLRSAYNELSKNQAFYRNAFARIRIAQGQQEKALQNHKIALKSTYPSFSSYLQISASELEQTEDARQRNVIFEELGKVFEQYGKPAEFYIDMIRLADSSQLPHHALSLKAECGTRFAGDGVLCSEETPSLGQGFSFKPMLNAFN